MVAVLLALTTTLATAAVPPPADKVGSIPIAAASPVVEGAVAADTDLLAWPPEAWKIRRASRRAQRKAYRVTRRSAGKTMGARRARAGKRRRAERRGFLGVGKLKSRARKTRQRRVGRRKF